EFDPTLNYWEGFSAAKSFELDNALPLLADYFPTVSVRRYEDELDVTEAEPLLAYMLSGPAKAVIVGEKRAALRDFLQQRIDSSGHSHHERFRITYFYTVNLRLIVLSILKNLFQADAVLMRYFLGIAAAKWHSPRNLIGRRGATMLRDLDPGNQAE